jgi:hypothetical protein
VGGQRPREMSGVIVKDAGLASADTRLVMLKDPKLTQ